MSSFKLSNKTNLLWNKYLIYSNFITNKMFLNHSPRIISLQSQDIHNTTSTHTEVFSLCGGQK